MADGDLLESLREEKSKGHFAVQIGGPVCFQCGVPFPCPLSRALDVAIGLGEAVEKAAEARGEFSIDHLQHGINTINNMQGILREALTAAKKTWEEGR